MSTTNEIREAFEQSCNFKIDEFQHKAFSHVESGKNVIVAAPTGAGKTLIADYAVELVLKTDGRIFYTTPIKALSNQKFRDLVIKYGQENVGLLTGDSSINSTAPVVVMTTEVLRNMIYAGNDLSSLRCVVLDEVHFLQDKFRGAVWEEVIIHLNLDVQLVCLSATVSNADQLTSWIDEVRGDTALVVETKRPIELQNYYMVGERSSSKATLVKVKKGSKVNSDCFKFDIANNRGRGRGQRGHKGKQRKRWETPKYLEVILALADKNLLPAIYFKFSRRGCDEATNSIVKSGFSVSSKSDRERVKKIIDENIVGLTEQDKVILKYDDFEAALLAGVAAHHAGLIPAFKKIVELCFNEGLLKVVFATETLALGINMPARTVVIDKLTKFTGETHEFLTPSQYTQLTGRAGRRGIDTIGAAVILWSPFIEFREVADLVLSKDFELKSSFRPNYNMAANLVTKYEPEKARQLLGMSFAQFRTDEQIIINEQSLSKLNRRKGKLKQNLGKSNKSSRDHRRIEKIEIEIQKTRKGNKKLKGTLVLHFDRVIELMENRGHIQNWQLTNSGNKLSSIYHESDLLITEVLQANLFDGLNPAELAGLVSVFCYEERRKEKLDSPPWFPSKDLKDRFGKILKIHASLSRQEARSRIDVTRTPDAGFMATAHAWSAGGALDDVLEDEDMPAGDFVRTTKQLIDLLRQISIVSDDASTRKVASQSVESIRRDIIDVSSNSGSL